jgi:hypothetical protein
MPSILQSNANDDMNRPAATFLQRLHGAHAFAGGTIEKRSRESAMLKPPEPEPET